MLLPLLPVLVLDVLIEQLDPPDLVNLSYTCKTLHAAAVPILYRHADQFCADLGRLDLQHNRQRHEMRLQSLEKCLLHNPRNALWLQNHSSFNVSLLKTLWQHVPLSLKWLRLPTEWFDSQRDNAIRDCILAKHVDTSVKDIIVGEDDVQEHGYGGLFPLLHTFKDLRRLTINLFATEHDWFQLHDDPDDLVRKINCPNLQELILVFGNVVVSLPDNLPGLKLLVVDSHGLGVCTQQFSEGELNYYTKREKWGRLVAFSKSSVNFVVLADGTGPTSLALYAFVFQYTRENGGDPRPVIQMLLRSNRDYDDIDPLFYLTLPRFPRRERDLILECLNDIAPHEKSIKLTTILFAEDTISTAALFPKETVFARFLIVAHIQPHLIRQIIRSCPNLETLTFVFYTGAQWDRILTSDSSWFASTCTDNPFDIAVPAMTWSLVRKIEATIRRGRPSKWGFRLLDVDSIRDPTTVTRVVDFSASAFENEIMDWMSLNPSLQSIDLTYVLMDFPESQPFWDASLPL